MIELIFQSASIVTMMGVMSCASTAGYTDEVLKFGVYEIPLSGDGDVNNPFDTIAAVTFTPPSGQANAKTVYTFYDGDNTWRARVYVSEIGLWWWASKSSMDKGLDGETGIFRAVDSKLREWLLPHPKNPRHWITEDGRWFLNINDTAYFLLSQKDQNGNLISHEDFAAYVRDAVEHGITSFRSWAAVGDRGCLEGIEAWNDAVFEDEGFTMLRLNNFRCSDQRLG